MLMPEEIEMLLRRAPDGYKRPDDEFFTTANNSFIDKYNKLGVISDVEPAETANNSFQKIDTRNEVFCNVPTCCRFFESVSAYNTHFNSVHRYICAQCNKSLPTSRLLDLHILEQHDSYFAARLERGEPMYECLLEECQLRYQTPKERKEHCIMEHNFPSNFRFDQVRKKSQSQCIDTRRDNSGTIQPLESAKYIEEKQSCFSFGHQKNKTFDFKKSQQANKIDGETLENLKSLQEALDRMS